MKKILIVSLLLLALVFTVVACQDPEEPVDTTVAETTKAEEPTAAPTQAEETTKAEEPTEDPGTVEEPATTEEPDTTKAPEPTKAPDTTKEPDTTEEPETEAPDPDAPVAMYGADALNNLTGATQIESIVLSEDGKYITITPSASDPHYYPLGTPANITGARYVAIKYRTDNADGTSMQIYIGSGTLDNDNDMLKQPIVADGQWHVAIFDATLVDGQAGDLTGATGDPGSYDGSTVAFFRLDALECDYILDENGMAQKDENGVWMRNSMPEGAYIDIQYVAFFNSPEAVEKYESQPLALVTPDQIASAGSNDTVATVGNGFTTLAGAGGNGDGYVNLISGASLNGKYVALKYRTTAAEGAGGEFFVGSGAGPAGVTDEAVFDYINDGEWHLLVVDVSNVEALTGAIAYLRYDFFINATGKSVDVAYIAVFETEAQALAYDSYLPAMPNLNQVTDIPFWTSVDHVNGAGPNGTPNYAGRGGNTNLGCDVIDGAADGKTVGFDYIVSVGGWCGTAGGIHRYVWTVDGITWYDCLEGSGRDGEPLEGHYAGLNFADALKNGMFNGNNFAKADLSAYAGQTVDVTFGFEPETAQGKVVAFVQITGLKVPGDDTHNFKSDVANQGEDFSASDVVNAFPANPSAGGSWYDVTGQNGSKVTPGESYHLANYNEMFVTANGKYAFSATILDNADPNRNFMFVRGVRNFDWGDQGYFGHDTNNNYAGCGGINVMVKDGVLTIIIRSYTEEACVRNIYTVDVDSNKITLADDGSTVYIVAGDTLVATVAISGTRDFAYTGFAGAVPADACADKVVLTLAGQEPVEIVDAVVASTCLSDVGMAVREHGNYITFSELSLVGFSTVTLPEFPKNDAPVEGASNTIVAEGMLALPADPQRTNKNLFGNDDMTNVEKLEDGDVIYTHYPIPAGTGNARVLFKRKYNGFAMDQYMIIRYRTNITQTGIINAGYNAGDGEGAVPAVNVTWIADGEWQLYALDISTLAGVEFDENGKISVMNLCINSDAVAADSYFDIDYIAFYADEASWKAAAGIVDEEPAAPSYTDAPAWDADKAIVTHQSFDELRINSGESGVFTAGQAASWDKVANLDASANSLYYWGWIGAKGEFGQFGYEIDQNGAIFDDSFTYPAEPGVVNAAAGTGADCSSRMAITIDISALSGEHTVSVYYKNAAGEVVLLNAFTVNR